MKVLYASYGHDPRLIDVASGADFQFLRALEREGIDVRVCGPVTHETALVERVTRRLYQSMTTKRYMKFTLSRTLRAGILVSKAVREFRSDVIFSLFPATVVHYSGKVPCVLRLDTTFNGYQSAYPEYGELALRISRWQERRAFSKAKILVTHSDWARRDLIENYRIPENRISCFPNPAALPNHIVPDHMNPHQQKLVELPWRLLLVGRDFHRKAVDVGIQIVDALNAEGHPSHLTVVGLVGESSSHVTFEGAFRKDDPVELKTYAGFYSRAHLLIHPSRFDPSPIVTSEAAAFSTPTVTHDVGGLATSVNDGISGIVLSKNSLPSAYVAVIIALLTNPDRYYELCESTRRRYDTELNWDVAGKRLAGIVSSVATKQAFN